MRVNCPSIHLGATFRPTGQLPTRDGTPSQAQAMLVQKGEVFTVTSVDDVGDHTRVTLSNGDQQITYGVETMLRGFSAVA